MTYDTALQVANILYEIEECDNVTDELFNVNSESPKLLQIIRDAITAIGYYKDELNRKLDKL